ncbi:DUF4258 domain-containing protein [Candidatus Uhrbacteria bacterium]|nr:DUF4258 domain-containing protein [Candidatus Uhrbacteria bacterium]
MQYKQLKNTPTLQWTKHAAEKMRLYGLSEARVKRVIENPERREEGIAEDTIACMQTAGSGKHPTEIWVMYTEKSKVPKVESPAEGEARQGRQKLKTVVSAWRYPGKTEPRDPVPIPENF